MREKHYISAFEEYKKRLGAYCAFELIEIPEQKLPDKPSEKQIDSALKTEAQAIERAIPKSAALIALCVEGREMPSEELSDYIASAPSRLCFVIGGSFGLHGSVKEKAALRLSMSKMTFPHHLARVMLAEQIYRAYMIASGGKYHK